MLPANLLMDIEYFNHFQSHGNSIFHKFEHVSLPFIAERRFIYGSWGNLRLLTTFTNAPDRQCRTSSGRAKLCEGIISVFLDSPSLQRRMRATTNIAATMYSCRMSQCDNQLKLVFTRQIHEGCVHFLLDIIANNTLKLCVSVFLFRQKNAKSGQIWKRQRTKTKKSRFCIARFRLCWSFLHRLNLACRVFTRC